jgi:para-nitrobenzyl esterase
MRYAFGVALTIAALLPVSSSTRAAGPEAAVAIREESLAGAAFPGGKVYFNVPFAQPPVGDSRWRAPVATGKWEGVRDATRRGAACMQPDQRWNAVDAARSSEDCLYLNIWRPTANKPVGNKPYPVMVWFHGGAFIGGAGNTPLYDGEALARRGVILVSVNYRLGVFGYLAHPELSAENSRGVSGNYGLLDQIEALRWVKRNIGGFGGDNTKVTIFGQSAGAASVGFLLAAPDAKGLFQRAILQSGTPFGAMMGRFPRLSAAQEAGKTLGTIADLRKLPAEELMARWLQSDPKSGESLRLTPIVDGVVLPKMPSDLFDEAGLAGVSIIAGNATREMGSNLPPDQLLAAAQDAFGNQAAAAMKTYAARADKVHRGSPADQFSTDLMFGCGPVRLARTASQAWVYEFSQHSPGDAQVRHSADLPYVFGNANKDGGVLTTRPFNRVEQALSDQLMAYWTNFAKTGNPNGRGWPKWPQFTPSHPASLWLSGSGSSSRPITKPQCEPLYAKWRRTG